MAGPRDRRLFVMMETRGEIRSDEMSLSVVNAETEQDFLPGSKWRLIEMLLSGD